MENLEDYRYTELLKRIYGVSSREEMETLELLHLKVALNRLRFEAARLAEIRN